MIRVENIEVHGFQAAIRGMRNPMNSWEKSDSEVVKNYADSMQEFVLGSNDLSLAKRLVAAGAEHRTFCRILTAAMDITAPLYWWKEMDRYTIGKSQVSCSTMHKIADKEFEYEDFSHEHLQTPGRWLLAETIKFLNKWREVYIKGNPVYPQGDKEIWWQMIQLLPTSYNQKRTVMMSYEVCLKIIRERRGHKLDEWEDFRQELLKLPYMQDFWEAANATRN